MWADQETETDQEADESELTDEQQAAIRQVIAALPQIPKHLQGKLEALLLSVEDEGDDGPTAVPVPA